MSHRKGLMSSKEVYFSTFKKHHNSNHLKNWNFSISAIFVFIWLGNYLSVRINQLLWFPWINVTNVLIIIKKVPKSDKPVFCRFRIRNSFIFVHLISSIFSGILLFGKSHISKVKKGKSPSLFLHQYIRTMNRPRVHSLSQWSTHSTVSF